jgi:tRNA threonylcarbamoyl adenosine modification protein (Sua5/YciO/YrdC/YwlC family)
MSQFFRVHPDNPQSRLIRGAVDILRNGGVVVYPTDSGYALGCRLDQKSALERIHKIRNLSPEHNFTLICRTISEAAAYARFGDAVFRLLRANTPGPYTFVLEATKEVPRRMLSPKRKSIGLRIPDHTVALALLAELDEPIMSTTLILPGEDLPMTDPEEMRVRLEKQVELVIDGGPCGTLPTTVVDLREIPARILREGKGDPAPFL